MPMQTAVPVLASLNLERSAAFYQDKLGFTVTFQDNTYLIVKRDAIQIHFWRCADKYIAENTSCYVYVDDVDALYAEYLPMQVVHPNGKLTNQPYGVREFSILDRDGNLLKFGQEQA